jgi:Xaa-Pro aminopeptidase
MITKLQQAEKLALTLFDRIQELQIISPLKFESEVNEEICQLAHDEFGIQKYWHKRIVRAGINTLFPYKENPTDIRIQHDDIVFLDFGPLIEDWEADLGRTYTLGTDPEKLKLCANIEAAWYDIKHWVETKKHNNNKLSCQDLFHHCVETGNKYGYSFGGEIAGHLVGQFPHEHLEAGNFGLYIHPENNLDLFSSSANGDTRHWILELHFVHSSGEYAAFFEQLLM